MRKRFRGNMPISSSLEMQGEGKGQLYAGGSAVGGMAESKEEGEEEGKES